MSLETVQRLLNKQKVVEGLVHHQASERREVVEGMVHRQHLVELQKLMVKLPTKEIGYILEALSFEDAKLLWKSIPEGRENEVLWELTEPLREELEATNESLPASCQINAFELIDGRLNQVAVSSHRDLKGLQPLWIDLVNATAAERDYVGKHFGLELQDPGDATDLEVTSRFHIEENNEIHLHSNFLLNRDGETRSVPVAFILHQGIVFTLRNEELPVFRLQRLRARTHQGYVQNSYDLLLDLYGTDVEYSADSLEETYRTLRRIGKQVLRETMTDEEAAEVLADIAAVEDLNGQIRSNILDTQRALVFLMQGKMLSQSQSNDAKAILKNIDSLNSHTAFLFDKINFLMDATIGFININQNRRINQLTGWGVVFMPLNILAGIGGMSEFSMMTKGTPWPVAYASFIIGLAFVGWATYLGLKSFESRKIQKIAKQKMLSARFN